jgi:hypothetical protein
MSEVGTPWRAARKIIMDHPTPFQTPAAQIAIMAVQRSASQEVEPSVSCSPPSAPLITP